MFWRNSVVGLECFDKGLKIRKSVVHCNLGDVFLGESDHVVVGHVQPFEKKIIFKAFSGLFPEQPGKVGRIEIESGCHVIEADIFPVVGIEVINPPPY